MGKINNKYWMAGVLVLFFSFLRAEATEPDIFHISTEINDSVAKELQDFLLSHENQFSNDAPVAVRIIINSPGGNAYDALGITDAMSFVSYTVETECTDMAGSCAMLILSMGSPGHRFAHKNSRILVHLAKFSSNEEITEKSRSELDGINREILSIIANRTHKSEKQIEADIINAGGELWLTADEAKEYGIIDEVIDP